MTLPGLRIHLKRHSDGSASITLTRANGSVTWQRQKGSLALVFPSHDLTHYAIEQTLSYRSGFYGLVADGWEISDFAFPWPRGPIPSQAREVEMVVGLFDGERRDRAHWDSAEFNAQLQQLAACGKFAGSLVPRTMSDDDLERVRAVRNALLARWGATPSGTVLELEFSRAALNS